MQLVDLPPEILTLISDFTGIYNFNLAKVSRLFRDITERNTPSGEEFQKGLFQEGDLRNIRRYCLSPTSYLEESIKHGHLLVLIWAYEKGLRLEMRLTYLAARESKLEILQWLRANGCPWSKWTCAEAAEKGHLEILKWLRANGCPWDIWTCDWAARGGHLDVLKWLRDPQLENGVSLEPCPWGENTCSLATEKGHLEVLKWLRANDCPWNKRLCTLLGRDSEVLRWIKNDSP